METFKDGLMGGENRTLRQGMECSAGFVFGCQVDKTGIVIVNLCCHSEGILESPWKPLWMYL